MKRKANDETGVTLPELLVVMAIGAIIAAAAVPSFLAARKGSSTTSIVAGATTVWQGISTFRMDNKQRFPPGSALVPASGTDYGSGLLVPNTQRRYIKTWPTESKGNRLKLVIAPGATSSPASLPAGPGEGSQSSGTRDSSYGDATLVYSVASSGFTAWLAAYDVDGKLIFRRSVDTQALGAPIG